ncbi:glycosyltransferase [Burkholderiaceae bacterium DAT-1]|nr:glycosyltransferase [Burkholderiaceae bacterium DAT-1]
MLPYIIVWAGNLPLKSHSTGLERVVRRLAQSTQTNKIPTLLAAWGTEGNIVLVAPDSLPRFKTQLDTQQYAADLAAFSSFTGERWLIQAEGLSITDYPPQTIVQQARHHGWRIAYVLHDLIPLKRSEFFRAGALPCDARALFATMLLADVVMPISEFVASDFLHFCSLTDTNAYAIPAIHVLHNMAGIVGIPRQITPLNEHTFITCVGSIEPRKRTLELAQAFAAIASDFPEWKLVFMGGMWPKKRKSPYFDAFRRLVDRHPQIQYIDKPNDAQMFSLIRRAAFTSFVSEEEGFGLPITESLWLGKPCLTANFGAMAEVAAEGGCYTVNVRQPKSLQAGLRTMMSNRTLREALTKEACTRVLQTQDAYVERLLSVLQSAKSQTPRPIFHSNLPAPERLYPNKPQHLPAASGVGVNLIGYLSGALGLGVTARAIARQLIESGIPLNLTDLPAAGFRAGYAGDLEDWISHPRKKWQPITMVVMGVLDAIHHNTIILRSRHDRFVVGLIFWELPKLPPYLRRHLATYDVLLAPSSFIYDMLDEELRPKVIRINLPMYFYAPAVNSVPPDHFRVLASFDAKSGTSRKNGQAVIRAWERAFPEPSSDRQLLIKVNGGMDQFGHPTADMIALQQAITRSDITLDIRSGSHAESVATLQSCSAYISLHRSEGFGQHLLESMWCGRPVICTGWSGHMDFTTEDNSCLVDYSLVPVPEDDPVYGKWTGDSTWAEPDEAQAAEYLRRLATDAAFYAHKSAAAKRDALAYLEAATPDWMDEVIRRYLHSEHAPDRPANRMNDLSFVLRNT